MRNGARPERATRTHHDRAVQDLHHACTGRCVVVVLRLALLLDLKGGEVGRGNRVREFQLPVGSKRARWRKRHGDRYTREGGGDEAPKQRRVRHAARRLISAQSAKAPVRASELVKRIDPGH